MRYLFIKLLSKKKKERFLENYFENIGDILSKKDKVTTLLPAQIERVVNTLLVFEGYY